MTTIIVPRALADRAAVLLRSYRDTRDCGIMGHQDETDAIAAELTRLAEEPDVPDPTPLPLPAGWAMPGIARKAHYFPAGEIRSLCGRYMFSNPDRENGRHDHPQNCMACRRAGGWAE